MNRPIFIALACCVAASHVIGADPPSKKAVTPARKTAVPAASSHAPAAAKKNAPAPVAHTGPAAPRSSSGRSLSGGRAATPAATVRTPAKSVVPSRSAPRRYYGRQAVRRSYTPQQAAPTSDRYREIQDALAAKGYLTTPPNGVWDKDAQAAMQRFQQDQNLEATGKLTARSLGALGLGPKTPVVTSSATRPTGSSAAGSGTDGTPNR